MDVNLSRCYHCGKTIHYNEAILLPQGGGVCLSCASTRGYVPCAECQYYFVPSDAKEHFCEICLTRIFADGEEAYE